MVINKGSVIIFLLCLLLFPKQTNAQVIDVVASSGGFFQGNKLTISFTVGESVIETLHAESIILTQGFQQPSLVVTRLNDFTNQTYTIKAYPNPTTNFVNLNTNITLPSGSYYYLTDILGSRIDEKTIDELTTKISFQQLVPSIYFLSVRHQGEILKTFKIIKR